jgi:formate hydrogenlyase transcriptional activator
MLLREIAETKISAAHLRKILDTIPTLASCNLPDGSNEFLNQRWHDYTGLSSQEARGRGWRVAVHPEDLQKVLDTFRALRTSGEPREIEHRLRRHDGEYRWFLFRVEPLRDELGNIVRWYATNTDIENLKRTEEKLRQDERELRRITDAIPLTIVIQQPDGTPIYANQAVLDYGGFTMEDVVASDFRARLFHPEDLERLREERQAGLSRGLPFEIEQRARRKDGQYRWFLVRYHPFLDEHGRLVRWYATGADIDDRKRTEDRVRNENIALREDIVRSSMFEEIVGSSAPLRRVLAQVEKVAPTVSTVLILGETGTGKELIARAIHSRSKRSGRAFIRVNCAAIPPPLVASELFGHERGAFTGALQRRLGRFESADGGTLFLDEVGELPPEAQVALLRVLQDREFERVGGSQTISVDVRVLAALRERGDDIPILVKYLVNRYAEGAGKSIRHITKPTLDLFRAYHWPGNVRELQNVIERAVILCDDETFAVDDTWLTPVVAPHSVATRSPLVANLVEHEREVIEHALREAEGVVGGPAGAAAKLGIPRQTLESKIKKLGIKPHRFKTS